MHSSDRSLIVLAFRWALQWCRGKMSPLDTMVFELLDDAAILFLDRYQKMQAGTILFNLDDAAFMFLDRYQKTQARVSWGSGHALAGWWVVWGNICEDWNVAGCGQKITYCYLLGLHKFAWQRRLLAGRYDTSDRGSSHEKILQGRSRLKFWGFPRQLSPMRLSPCSSAWWGVPETACSLPDGMPCFKCFMRHRVDKLQSWPEAFNRVKSFSYNWKIWWGESVSIGCYSSVKTMSNKYTDTWCTHIHIGSYRQYAKLFMIFYDICLTTVFYLDQMRSKGPNWYAYLDWDGLRWTWTPIRSKDVRDSKCLLFLIL